MKVIPYYDRADLIQRTISTVAHNLAEGAILVSVLLFLFLGDIRASLIVAAVIPLSMLAAFVGMNWIGVSGNLMSLGAIDFGLIVDGSVVMMENIYRRLAAADRSGASMAHRVFEAGGEVLRPIVFAIGIIIVVYLPILSFHEVEGKMFRPMALTVIFALCGSLVFALTLVPVLASLLLRPGVHREPWLSRVASRLHERFGRVASRWPREIVIATAAVLILSFALAPLLGTEFIPTLDEGTINLDVMQVPSISLEDAVRNATAAEKAMLELPEVARVVSRIGRPEIATDTSGPDESDVYVFLKPRDQWRVRSRDQLIDEIQRTLNQHVPEMQFGFSQPIESRVNDMIAGVKGDVAIHIYGDDMTGMLRIGQQIRELLRGLPGAADLKMIPRSGLPSVNIEVDRAAVARYGINVSDVLATVATIGGHVVGQVVEGQARYPLQVRFDQASRVDLGAVEDIQVGAPDGTLIPLAQLAHLKVSEGPVSIWRQNLTRRIIVAANVRGTDLGSFVAKARSAVEQQVHLPSGWHIEWGGQYENLATRLASAHGAGACLAGSDPRPSLQHLQLDEGWTNDLQQCPARRFGWNSRPAGARTNLLDYGRRGVHHTLWRFGAERRCAGLGDQSFARDRPSHCGGAHPGLARAAEAHPDGVAGCAVRVRPDGAVSWRGRGGAAPAGHRRDRRAHHFDPVHALRPANYLRLVRSG